MHFKNDLKSALHSVLRKVPASYKVILWFYVPFPSVSPIFGPTDTTQKMWTFYGFLN